jgi:hypothetical protein
LVDEAEELSANRLGHQAFNHLRVPVNHRRYVRTTNLIERSFLEGRRRTKIIPQFFDERSCLKLAFATLQRASERWQRIRITELEQKQIEVLRQDLGLDPDPAPTHRSREMRWPRFGGGQSLE